MSISTKAIAILGLVIGAGAVTLPINHNVYADTTGNTGVSVTVAQLLELSTAGGPLNISNLSVNSNGTSNTATVSINQNVGSYSVTVKTQRSAGDATRTTTLNGPDTIAAGAASGSGARWCLGVSKNAGSATNFATTPYSNCLAVTSAAGGDTVATHSTGTGTDILDVNFRVWSAANQIAGDYTATLVFTVAAN